MTLPRLLIPLACLALAALPPVMAQDLGLMKIEIVAPESCRAWDRLEVKVRLLGGPQHLIPERLDLEGLAGSSQPLALGVFEYTETAKGDFIEDGARVRSVTRSLLQNIPMHAAMQPATRREALGKESFVTYLPLTAGGSLEHEFSFRARHDLRALRVRVAYRRLGSAGPLYLLEKSETGRDPRERRDVPQGDRIVVSQTTRIYQRISALQGVPNQLMPAALHEKLARATDGTERALAVRQPEFGLEEAKKKAGLAKADRESYFVPGASWVLEAAGSSHFVSAKETKSFPGLQATLVERFNDQPRVTILLFRALSEDPGGLATAARAAGFEVKVGEEKGGHRQGRIELEAGKLLSFLDFLSTCGLRLDGERVVGK